MMSVEWVALITTWLITGAFFNLAVGCMISFREPEEIYINRLRVMCVFMFPPILIIRVIHRLFVK